MKKPYLEIFGVINQDEKCYEIGIKYHGIDKELINIPNLLIRKIWTISALWYYIGKLTSHLIEKGIRFCFYAELRLKGS